MLKVSANAMSPVELFKHLETSLPSDWAGYEPESIQLLIEVDNIDKLLAVQAVANNPSFALENHTAFENVGNAFCNEPVFVDASHPLNIGEVHYTIKNIRAIIGDIYSESIISRDIKGYIAAIAKKDDMIVLPYSLQFAQEVLDMLNRSHFTDVVFLGEYNSLMAMVKDQPELENLTLNLVDKYASVISQSPYLRMIIGSILYDPTNTV